MISLEEEVISVMLYLYFWRKLDVVKILPVKTVSNNRATEVPHGHLSRSVLCLFKDEAKLQLRGC